MYAICSKIHESHKTLTHDEFDSKLRENEICLGFAESFLLLVYKNLIASRANA